MGWTIVFANSRVEAALLELQPSFMARFIRYAERMEVYGPDLGMPHTRAMGGGLFELRLKGPDGQRIVILHHFAKKSPRTPAKELATARERLRKLLQ